MKSIRKSLLLLLGVMMIMPTLVAQKEHYASLQDALFSASALNSGRGPSNVVWIEGGEKYSFTRTGGEAQEIWTKDIKSLKEEKVFSTEGLLFPGTDDPFRYVSFQWADNFRSILFQTNFNPVWRYSGNSDYYIWSFEDKALKLIATQAFTAEVSPDGKKVGYGKDGDLYHFVLATGEVVRLTDDAHGQVYNGRFGWAQEEEFGLVQGWKWSGDSRFIAYWQSDESEVPVYRLTDFSGHHPEYMEVPYPKVGDNPPSVRIGVADTEGGEKRWLDIDIDGGYIPRIYWTSRPNTLAVLWMNRIQDHMKVWFVDVVTGEKKLVLEEKAKGWIDIFDFFAGVEDLIYFPEETDQFFWISERDGWAHIYRYDYNGNLINQVTSGEWEVKSINAVSVKDKSLLYVSTEKSPLAQNLYSIRFDGSRKSRITAGEFHHTLNVSDNGKYFIDTWSDVNTPSVTALMDTRGRELERLVSNDRVLEYLGAHQYAPKELFSFTAADGQKLDGYLIKPVDFDPAKQYPMVLDIYGGPGSQGVFNTFGTNGWHQWLAESGFVVASVNNRGNGGYGAAFEKVVHRQLGKMESYDFAETARYLASMPWVDGERMAIRGHSFGGYTSSYTMLTHPGVFRASIVAAPVTDHLFYDCILTERYMGLMDDNAEGYRQSAVTTHAANLDGHLLLAHSLMDENVHPQHTFQLVNAFNMAGKDFELKIYPPGAHGLYTNTTTYLLLMQQYTDFLERSLK
jgi:dipeptidyl-peptidase-4